MLSNGSSKYVIAAGCFGNDGYGKDFPTSLTLERFAAVTLKTTTLRPRKGNPGITLHHSADFTLNAVGLRNPGIDRVLSKILPAWQTHGCPVGLSIWGKTPAEYRILATQAAAAGVDYIELNLSCVNADTPTLQTMDIANIAGNCNVPVYAKIGLSQQTLPPTAADARMAAEIAGITALAGVIIGNTISVPTEGLLDTPAGGLSGDRLRHYNLAWLAATAPKAQAPLIAAGGISNARHIAEYRQAGGAGFQVGSAMLRTPATTWEAVARPEATNSQRDQAKSQRAADAYSALIAQYRQAEAAGQPQYGKEPVAQAEIIAEYEQRHR